MKRPYLILLLLCVGWYIGCTPTTQSYPPKLRIVEDCMETAPDTAWAILHGMADSIGHLPEDIQMYYHLLMLQAEDLQYMLHTDDSLINRIVAYYDKHGDKNKQRLSYYLKGKVYVDMNDAPQALEAYQQALNLAMEQPAWKRSIYHEMYSLFTNQGMYDDAIRATQQLLLIYKASNDLQEMTMAKRNIARLFNQKGEKDSALHYFEQAGNMALGMADSATYYEMQAEHAGIRYEMDGAIQALPLLRKAELRKDILDKSYIYSLLSQIYTDQKLWDSAHYYNKKVVESGNIEKTYHSYKNLYELEKQRGNHSKAFEYIEKALNSRNLLQTISQREAVAQINALYNYQHIADENAGLRLNKEKQKNVILILILLSIGITFAGFAFNVYLRRKNRLALARYQKQQQIADEKFAQSQLAINNNKQMMKELGEQLTQAQKENNQLISELLRTRIKKLELDNESIQLIQAEQSQRIKAFRQSDLNKRIQQAASDENYLLTESDWIQIQAAINIVYPTFNGHMEDIYPNMPTHLKQLCWLTKLGISPSGIARILKRSRQAVSNSRAKLKNKLADLSLFDEEKDEY